MDEPVLDLDQPFGKTFFGEGKPRKQDRDTAFFQNGLYFDATGKFVHNEHNAEVLEARLHPEAKPKHRGEDIEGKLLGESDETIFRMALNLTRKLAKEGETVDYEPDVGERDANIKFIADHS